MTAIPVISLQTIQASLTEADILEAVKGALMAQASGGHCQRKNNYLPKRKFGI